MIFLFLTFVFCLFFNNIKSWAGGCSQPEKELFTFYCFINEVNIVLGLKLRRPNSGGRPEQGINATSSIPSRDLHWLGSMHVVAQKKVDKIINIEQQCIKPKNAVDIEPKHSASEGINLSICNFFCGIINCYFRQPPLLDRNLMSQHNHLWFCLGHN